jgi:hypothetical protein
LPVQLPNYVPPSQEVEIDEKPPLTNLDESKLLEVLEKDLIT